MDRKVYTTILSIILIGSFFMPYLVDGPTHASGIDIVTMPENMGPKDKGFLIFKYIWILIPFSGIMLLIGALNNGRYLIGRWAWAFLPLGVLLFVVFKIYRDAKRNGFPITINELRSEVGYGFWIALVVALLLFFYWPKKELRKV